MLSFKPTFSLSSFTFIKRLFSSSSLSAIVLSVYMGNGACFVFVCVCVEVGKSGSATVEGRGTPFKA